MAAVPAATLDQQRVTAADDEEIFHAVVEQSVKPYVALEREIVRLPSGPVQMARASLKSCGQAGAAPPVCATVDGLVTPDDQGFVVGSWDYREETRRALVEAFNARNSESAPLASGGHPDLTIVDRDRARADDFLIELSQPGYTSNGFALVYGQSSRASKPLQGWAFVLSHASGQWVVQHAYLLWIRQ